MLSNQEPAACAGKDGFRVAFLRSINEFNQYGIAAGNGKYQIPDDLGLQLFGFRVAWLCSATNSNMHHIDIVL